MCCFLSWDHQASIFCFKHDVIHMHIYYNYILGLMLTFHTCGFFAGQTHLYGYVEA